LADSAFIHRRHQDAVIAISQMTTAMTTIDVADINEFPLLPPQYG
jgi:hypothetical protein